MFKFYSTEEQDPEVAASGGPSTDNQPGPEETGAFEGDEFDQILQVTQEPEKGFQASGRQKKKQKSRWVGKRTGRR